MKAIQRYEIQNPKLGQALSVDIPINSTILNAEVTGTSLVIYAFVPDNFAGNETRYLALYVAGQELPANEGTYLFTIQTSKATWFLFELSLVAVGHLTKEDGTSFVFKDDATSKLLKE